MRRSLPGLVTAVAIVLGFAGAAQASAKHTILISVKAVAYGPCDSGDGSGSGVGIMTTVKLRKTIATSVWISVGGWDQGGADINGRRSLRIWTCIDRVDMSRDATKLTVTTAPRGRDWITTTVR